LISSAQARAKEAEALKAEYEKIKAVLEQLKEKPDDADANLTAGKYYCLQKGNWDAGLPLLAKGSDAILKEQAVRDQAGPKEAEAQLGVGDDLMRRLHRHHDRKRRRRDDIRVAQRLRGSLVTVSRVVVTDRIRELADLFATYFVRLGGGVNPAHK